MGASSGVRIISGAVALVIILALAIPAGGRVFADHGSSFFSTGPADAGEAKSRPPSIAPASFGTTTPVWPSAPDGSKPQPHVSTSGPAGRPAAFRLPVSTLASPAAAPAGPSSPNDWTADFTDDFEAGLSGATWSTFDLSDDGIERTWGADDYLSHSGFGATWVAAGGADGIDPEYYFYPDNLDAWLVSQYIFDLTTVQMADVEFSMYIDTEPETDWIFVGASADGEYFAGAYWTGFSQGWETFNLDLSEFIGLSEVYIAWYFHSDESSDGDYEGVWLDDVAVWTYVDTGPAQGTEKLQNGGFETGSLSSWTAAAGSQAQVVPALNPVAGSYVARFGGASNVQSSLHQVVELPAGDVDTPRFSFWLNQFGSEAAGTRDLFCAGIYETDLTTPLVDLGCLDGVEAVTPAFDSEAWWPVDYELTGAEWSAVRGRTVAVRFTMTTDGANHTTVLLDDVSLELVTGGSAGDPAEPNDSPADATVIASGQTMMDLTIDPDGDRDYYAFTAGAGAVVTVDIAAAENGSSLDSYLELLGPDGALVCANDDDGISIDSYLACTVSVSGTHSAVVTSYDGRGDRSNFYTISVQVTGSALPAPTPPPATPPPPPPQNDARAWTAMLYIDGDNNLCDSYPGLIARMEDELGPRIGANGFLNIVVLFDRDPRYCGDGGTTRYVVQPNGDYADNVNRWDMGELNMGDPQTLVNFGNWAMQNYPAEHYYLAIDNHGSGVRGIAWDDSDGHDNLENPELYAALKEITQGGARKLDVLAYEACLMAMYENAYDIREFAGYLFGFPTVSWTNTAAYPSYLGHPDFSSTSTGRQLGDIMFDVYYAAVTNPYAVSLIDTGKLAALHAATSAWADALRNQVGANAAKVTAARDAAQKIDQNGDDQLTAEDGYIDLWDLAHRTAAQGIAVSESSAVKAAVTAAVVRSAQRSGGALAYGNTHGLSIYWPRTASGAYQDYVGDRIYKATRDGGWDEFLAAFFGSPKGTGGIPYNPGPVERRPAGQHRVFLPSVTRGR